MKHCVTSRPVLLQPVLSCIFLLCLLSVAPAVAQEAEIPKEDVQPDLPWWTPDARAAHAEYESALAGVPTVERLATLHEEYSEEPHVAGSPGDRRMIEKLALDFRALGLAVEVHRFHAYLPRFVAAELEIVASPEIDRGVFGDAVFGGRDEPLPLALPIQEEPAGDEKLAAHPDLLPGWNAYAASGEVEAGVVYANRATREDFERLAEHGVDVEGKIVLARYGGNFRGYKEKFAADAGAGGLVIFTDPGDSGYARGPVWPEGGWANGSYIQRGSILTLPYPGDPLTPGVEATVDAERLQPSKVDFPTIPVQPIGWAAAWEILRRMDGEPVPAAWRKDWQGGLPTTYRLDGGDELRLRMKVKQTRELVETANVIGYLRGAERSEEMVVVGCHHDAWSFGAGDPNSGSILVTEAARAFAEAAKRNKRPARTIAFAHWGAEEFGIIGSVEWVEAKREELLENAVAYLNLDMAGMGTRFGLAASPSLKRLFFEASQAVNHPDGGTIWDQWSLGAQSEGEPPVRDLGGGSDHVGFYCHAGVPSASYGAWGPGTSYHSNYEHLEWYRDTLGGGYEGPLMLTRLTTRVLARLADAELLPLDPTRYAPDLLRHLDALETRNGDAAPEAPTLRAKAEEVAEFSERVHGRLLEALASGELDAAELARANEILLGMERLWLDPEGLPERPWYRNLFAATDADSGYASWMLPALRWTLERDEVDRWTEMEGRYVEALSRLEGSLGELESLVP